MALSFWRISSSRMKRLCTIVAFFFLAIIITMAGTLTPLTSSDANNIKEEMDKLRENVSAQYIFGNNMMICLIMFVPIIGPLFGTYALYNTGVVIEAESMTRLHVSPIVIFLSLFFLPFTWLEFIAYSTAAAASIWLTWRLIQRKGRHELVRTCIFIAICAVLLLAGAIVEDILIAASA